MAYFCLDCWNQLNETNDSKKKYIISRELLLCEGCATLKNVILEERKYYYLHKIRFLIFPFQMLCRFFYFLWRLCLLPGWLYKNREYIRECRKKDKS